MWLPHSPGLPWQAGATFSYPYAHYSAGIIFSDTASCLWAGVKSFLSSEGMLLSQPSSVQVFFLLGRLWEAVCHSFQLLPCVKSWLWYLWVPAVTRWAKPACLTLLGELSFMSRVDPDCLYSHGCGSSWPVGLGLPGALDSSFIP